MPPGTVLADTRLVLTNAIYFKATWLSPFPKEQTKKAAFEKTASDKIPVAMMRSPPCALTFSQATARGAQAAAGLPGIGWG